VVLGRFGGIWVRDLGFGPLWGRFGILCLWVHFGSILGRFMTNLGQFGSNMGSISRILPLWVHFGLRAPPAVLAPPPLLPPPPPSRPAPAAAGPASAASGPA
uniref:Uncharacterized protein n=1 Tax=Anas platyrhynchos platyrhynchos TaxID=8840 RepID=A0A493SUK1_ANAPP